MSAVVSVVSPCPMSALMPSPSPPHEPANLHPRGEAVAEEG
eukprot:CAMPEP_0177236070 /NCGR_PEP_ID=MMETSP0367-20130122/45264_1 /TAXON_ID=447022 ORGANISM="Scrippsiella hangoei-like, Strain SHHI-4" /NCGR_SAMPLE_ID=MMETSP0367 /ASSEMBLY_ACC=CAM_ASM_000362 /LENGTH=40 /DNA_ID= /DNA_START= /DNA_END= /DNA_ORIENTATION=